MTAGIAFRFILRVMKALALVDACKIRKIQV